MPFERVGPCHRYQLPGGGTLDINPTRQAKKLIQQDEGLSPRQMRRRKKELQREAKRGR